MNIKQCVCGRLLPVAIAAFSLVLGWHESAVAGKPPVVTAKPIDYNIQYFTAPNGGAVSHFEDMNSSGAVVGNYYTDSSHVSGYLYDPFRSVTTAVDLHSLATLPSGWYITYPRGINNAGAIVATVWHATLGERAMLLDPNGPKDANGKWIAAWLPDLPASIATMPRRINDHGDILLCAVFSTTAGEYVPYVCNPGIYSPTDAFDAMELGFNIADMMNIDMSFPVAGQPLTFAGVCSGGAASFRYTLGGTLETFSMQNVNVFSINGYGTFCGRQTISTIGKGGRTTLSSQTFRLDSAITSVGTTGKYALDINNSNDIAANSKFLIHNEKGTLDLNTLVIGTAADVNYFKGSYSFESLLTERSGNGFPVMGLKVGDLGCILVPSVPLQP
ncbi:MAG: hypothetical protein WKF77_06500 [Planctomycetaceae bacterium]